MPTEKGTNVMSKIRFLLSGILLLGLCAAAVRAAQQPLSGEPGKANLDVMLDALRANRKAMVAINLGLSDDEAAKFWPIYDRYQKEINAIQDRVVQLIQEYTANFRDLSNDKAMKLVEDFLGAEADRVKVRRSYVDEFAKAIPGRKLARFYQIENKMDAVIRYDLASKIPVIEEPSSAPAK
jgi:hypothetical protein